MSTASQLSRTVTTIFDSTQTTQLWATRNCLESLGGSLQPNERRPENSSVPLPRDRLPPIQPPTTLVTTNLPPLPFPTPSTASTRRESGLGFTFPDPKPTLPRTGGESVPDPQLPPLKRARVGHHRLQSIGELNLLRNNEPCLRCRAANSQCDANHPCSRLLPRAGHFADRCSTPRFFCLDAASNAYNTI
ncbi:hypothetical protein NW754_012447 [Fusarium falciforme]|nr:hypothetical protein NW754_012447 [Fusarium falciforme]